MRTKKLIRGDSIGGASFIDRYEVEEMLRDYYNFEMITDSQWAMLDSEVKAKCRERRVNGDYSEEYVRICDLCCELLGFPKCD